MLAAPYLFCILNFTFSKFPWKLHILSLHRKSMFSACFLHNILLFRAEKMCNKVWYSPALLCKYAGIFHIKRVVNYPWTNGQIPVQHSLQPALYALFKYEEELKRLLASVCRDGHHKVLLAAYEAFFRSAPPWTLVPTWKNKLSLILYFTVTINYNRSTNKFKYTLAVAKEEKIWIAFQLPPPPFTVDCCKTLEQKS